MRLREAPGRHVCQGTWPPGLWPHAVPAQSQQGSCCAEEHTTFLNGNVNQVMHPAHAHLLQDEQPPRRSGARLRCACCAGCWLLLLPRLGRAVIHRRAAVRSYAVTAISTPGQHQRRDSLCRLGSLPALQLPACRNLTQCVVRPRSRLAGRRHCCAVAAGRQLERGSDQRAVAP